MAITLENLYDRMSEFQKNNKYSDVLLCIVGTALNCSDDQLNIDYNDEKSFAVDNDPINITTQAEYLKIVIAKRCKDDVQEKIEKINKEIILVEELIIQANKIYYDINWLQSAKNIIKAAEDFSSVSSRGEKRAFFEKEKDLFRLYNSTRMVQQFISNLKEDQVIYNKVVDQLKLVYSPFSEYLRDKEEYEKWEKKYSSDTKFKKLQTKYIKAKIELQMSQNNASNIHETKQNLNNMLMQMQVLDYQKDPITGYFNKCISYRGFENLNFLNLLSRSYSTAISQSRDSEQFDDNSTCRDSEQEEKEEDGLSNFNFSIDDANSRNFSQKEHDDVKFSSEENASYSKLLQNDDNQAEESSNANWFNSIKNFFNFLCNFLFSSCQGNSDEDISSHANQYTGERDNVNQQIKSQMMGQVGIKPDLNQTIRVDVDF